MKGAKNNVKLLIQLFKNNSYTVCLKIEALIKKALNNNYSSI